MSSIDYVTELANLERALLSGVLEVRSADGKMTKFDDADGLRARITFVEGRISAGTTTPYRGGVHLARFRRD